MSLTQIATDAENAFHCSAHVLGIFMKSLIHVLRFFIGRGKISTSVVGGFDM
jgi:hypothetical protein